TIYYQYSGGDEIPTEEGLKWEQSIVYKQVVPADGNGEHTFIIYAVYKKFLHIWAKIDGKLESYQHHLRLDIILPPENVPGHGL
ncbi:MAG: hypothetical protein Q3992_06655, partial [Bacteroides sp.]|nr:hypothetical protein [Bacteroides sp.]